MAFYTLGLVFTSLFIIAVQVHYCKKLARLPNKGTEFHRKHTQGERYHLKTPPPCGKPTPGNVTRCQTYIKHSDCRSFPAKPHHVRIKLFLLNNTSPVLQVEWDASTTGFSDLWGFQVWLIEVSLYHPMRYFRCTQINSKDNGRLFVHFEHLSFGADYELRVQSMPPNSNHSNKIIKQVNIKEQCQIDTFKDRSFCCKFSTVVCHVNSYKLHGKQMISINITWVFNCTNSPGDIKLKWEPDKPYYQRNMCSGKTSLQNVSHFVIRLPGECSTLSLNYTGEIFATIVEQERTKTHKFQFSIPQFATDISTLPTTGYHSTSHLTVIAVVVGIGTILGIFLVCLVFGILRRSRQDSPLIRLESGLVVRSDTDRMLSDPVKVLILHASCCVFCKKVVYCLWDVLDSTNLFDVRLDILSEPKLNENPLRWYETQVKEARRILLLTSKLMQIKDQNLETRTNAMETDYVSIRCQLNLLRGELCSTKDASKYVPVYMDYNGNKEDIPRFLSMCRSYRFACDLEKVILHLLGTSSVRKHSSRPIVEVSSDSHPFQVKREAFVKAIDDAEQVHEQMQNTHVQENLII